MVSPTPEQQRAWRLKNPDRVRLHNQTYYNNNKEEVKYMVRSYKLRKQYGITPIDYDEILEAQGGHCKFCHRTKGPSNGFLVVDHCHKTGKIRGLLCVTHNSALAAFGDSEEGILKLLEYLKPRG
jgi:peptidyl-tRNA hydrolase